MSDYQLSKALLTGRDDAVMVGVLDRPVHRALVAPFQALRDDAARAGFDLRIVSGFRSFDRQLAIWNAKASGQRTLLDSRGCELAFETLDESALVDCILRWSALPGASRHHWGSDIDVIDAAAVPDDYEVQLTPAEVKDDGPFAPMHDWLDKQLSNGAGYGFFRPYNEDRGGIAPERWHLSYAPLSARCEAALRPAVLRQQLEDSELLLKANVLARLDELFRRYVSVPAEVYPSAYAPLLVEGERE
ncbi:M15 family metallopeptidase [Spongiibacter tropicus]|uniref:M15 family metallopeptidase n=1 Tax=Spongiibacter tropicus TaxID=454602 RepID=UPI0003B72C8C|nr:M15 family metallopeptidase [Spongiibacter tropicus]